VVPRWVLGELQFVEAVAWLAKVAVILPWLVWQKKFGDYI